MSTVVTVLQRRRPQMDTNGDPIPFDPNPAAAGWDVFYTIDSEETMKMAQRTCERSAKIEGYHYRIVRIEVLAQTGGLP